MNFEFANVTVLYLVWLVPALGVWWYAVQRRRRRALDAFVSPVMQAKLAPAVAPARSAWQSALILAGLLACLFAAARPQWGSKEEVMYQRGRDLVIALDVSRSMLAGDVHPNRLQRAKADILDLVKELRGDRAALIAFRRKAALLCPLTTDYAFLRHALDAAGIHSAPPGETDLGDALVKALAAFESEEGSHKAVILISDGEDLAGRAREAAQEARARGIPIFTVGLGSRGGAPVPGEANPDVPLTYRGETVTTRLDNDTLYALAEETGGAYIPVETAGAGSTTLGTLYRDHLRQIAARDLQETLQRRRVERFQWFLFPGVVLLIAGASLSRGRLKVGRTPPPLGAGVAALLILLAPPPGAAAAPADPRAAPDAAVTNASAAATNGPAAAAAAAVPSGRPGALAAQRLYRRGRYDESAAAYLQAAQGASAAAQRDYRFNAAVALFKAGKQAEAADLLRPLARQERDSQGALAAALGTALYQASAGLQDTSPEGLTQKALLVREAGEAFKTAARAQARNESALRNLAVACNALPKAEEAAKIARLMALHGQTPPSQLAHQMLSRQRSLNEELPAAFTNPPPVRIRALDSLAERQAQNADLWIPLKGNLMQAMAAAPQDPTNQQLIAQLNQLIEATRDNMLGAAERMEDLDPAAAQPAAVAEVGVYQMWKAIGAYSEILTEDLWRQTNAIRAADGLAAPDDRQVAACVAQQREAAGLSRLFAERFARAVPEGGTASTNPAAGPSPAPPADAAAPAEGADTNALPASGGISAETRAQILELAAQAVTAQEQAADLLEQRDAASAAGQRRSHALLEEIARLLPRQESPSREEHTEQKQQQESEQQQAEQPPAEQPPAEQPQPKPEEQEQKEKPPQTPEDVKRMLEKALQREKEHEEEIRERMRDAPSVPVDRDW